MQLKIMEPQSRFVVNVLFRRNFNTFSEEARKGVNWVMLGLDLALVALLLL